jgi:hypothetical protein
MVLMVYGPSDVDMMCGWCVVNTLLLSSCVCNYQNSKIEKHVVSFPFFSRNFFGILRLEVEFQILPSPKNWKPKMEFLTKIFAYPLIMCEELLLFSAHSLRVWACVLLNKARMNPTFIKKCLHWLGNAFMMCLHDISKIQDRHILALSNKTSNISTLLSDAPANTSL